jgi:exopolysaccharide/PEP-CTERM locus tyrosine autokinase
MPASSVASPPPGAPERRHYDYGGRKLDIDIKALRSLRLVGPLSSDSQIGDEYRAIKRQLLRNVVSGADLKIALPNVIMVTSAHSGEGKTFTCINLALSIAREKDYSVVVVDGDCEKRDLSTQVGVADEPGLTNLLTNPELDFDGLVMPSSNPQFSLLPAGAPSSHAAELFTSRRMSQLCSQLLAQDPSRIILFDSPPLMQSSLPQMLSSQVGQVLMVVRANETPQQVVIDAQETLDTTKAIGLVLNRARRRDKSDYYGYYSPHDDLPAATA